MAQQTKKRAPRKRRTSKNTPRKKRSVLFPILKFFALLLALIVVGAGGYYYGYDKGSKEQLVALNSEKLQNFELKNKLNQMKSASHEYDKEPPKPHKRVKKPAQTAPEVLTSRPMLSIIIDDVSFGHDVRNIKALGLPLNMSFLPPSDRHPHSAKLAAEASFYMVHLPLQAMSFGSEEPATLHVGDNAGRIEARVREIRELFPKVRFINNHTGSRFTADKQSMERLIEALDREGITFIDSRTTGKTVVPALMKSLHRPYIGRDVFLDHDPEIASIKKQVRRAVKIAKKYGSAIAIGHPHKKTLQAIAESREVLESVQLVYIDTLVAHAQK